VLLPALPLLALLLLTLLLGACGGGEDAPSAALTADRAANGNAASEPTDALAAAEPTAAEPTAAGAPAANGAQPPRSRTAVEAVSVQPEDFVVTGTYIGHLQPRERVELRSELDGVVERVLFDESQAVKQGSLLANISTEALRVRRDLAKAELKLAEATFVRESELNTRKLLSDAQLDQTRTRRDLARFALRLAEIELKKSLVTAPLDGTVKTRAVNVGEFLNKGQLIAEILDVRQVRAVIHVPEREVRFIQPGGPVGVTFDALPGARFDGAVRVVGLEADLKTRTFPVEVELDNRGGQLRAGMLARVEAPLQAYRDQVLVPRHAVLEREQGRYVYVAQDGAAVERRIETGASSGGNVQVLRGLAPGELLIVTGQQRLTPGEPVEVRQPAR
jgi:membrane fusion protein (multidrug efflux system)